MDTIEIDVLGCAVCGEGHNGLTARRLEHPENSCTHVTSCPTTGSDILVKLDDLPATDA
jgi:hypothetical protein